MDYLKKIRKGEKPPVELMLQEDWRLQPEVAEQLGEMIDQKGNFNLFPNFWITFSQVCLRLPKGVNKTELRWFAFVPEEYDDERRQEIVDRANHYFGPAGMLEQDDGENCVNEHAQLWTWRCWADWMNANSWLELKAHHTMPPAVGKTL